MAMMHTLTTKETLKSLSPFTQIFVAIKTAVALLLVSNDKENDDLEPNAMYCPHIIDWLLEFYMPFCFIWASFSLKGYGVTRMSNGLAEMYNGYRKGGKEKKVKPGVYLESVIEGVESHAFRYQEEIKKQPETSAEAAAKKAKYDRIEAAQLQIANENDEHYSADVWWGRNCGMPRPPRSFQQKVLPRAITGFTQATQVPEQKSQPSEINTPGPTYITAQEPAETNSQPEKKLLTLKSAKPKGCDICGLGKFVKPLKAFNLGIFLIMHLPFIKNQFLLCISMSNL
jgi:hypothetical protein